MKKPFHNFPLLIFTVLIMFSSFDVFALAGGESESQSFKNISMPRLSRFRRNYYRRQNIPISGKRSLNVLLLVAPLMIGFFFWRKSKISAKAEDVSKALKKMSARDPSWCEENLCEYVHDTFLMIQKSWSKQEHEKLKEVLHPFLYKTWSYDMERMKKLGEINVLTNINVSKISFVDVQNYHNDEKDNFTVYISGSCTDRWERCGIETSRKTKLFEEFWTYEWESGKWALLRVQQIGAWERIVNRKIINEAKIVSRGSKKAA